MRIPIGLSLDPFDSTDAATVRAWRNDWRVIRWCRQNDVISDVDQAAWYERQAKDPAIKMYSVRLKSGAGAGELVGVAGLTSIDWVNRRAEFSLYVAPDRWRHGIARGALSILLSHAFLNLGFEQVWGEAFAGNPALTLFAELGFHADGIRRGWYFKDGAYHDAHLISITRSEWYGRVTRATTAADPGDVRRDAGNLAAAGAPAPQRAGAAKRSGRAARRGLAAVIAGAEGQDAGGGSGRPASGAEGSQGAGTDA